jgi:hypothetical protein
MMTRILHAVVALLVVVVSGCADTPASPSRASETPATTQAPLAPSIAGDYTLTFTAAPSCSLPADIARRRYTATIAEPRPGLLAVDLRDADFAWGATSHMVRFSGTRDGDELRFSIEVGERVDTGRELSYYGTATATLADRSIGGTFNGHIWLNAAGNLYDWLADCAAGDHTIDFVRR